MRCAQQRQHSVVHARDPDAQSGSREHNTRHSHIQRTSRSPPAVADRHRQLRGPVMHAIAEARDVSNSSAAQCFPATHNRIGTTALATFSRVSTGHEVLKTTGTPRDHRFGDTE